MVDLRLPAPPSIADELDPFHCPLVRRERVSPHGGWVSEPAEREAA